MSTPAGYLPVKRFAASLKLAGTNYAYRCDAKFADAKTRAHDEKIRAGDFFFLAELLPLPFVKGIQPVYLDQPGDDAVPVINTLSIQNLSLREDDCRRIAREDFDALNDDRKLKRGDVLLTVDGGVSIGKPLLFDLEGDYTVDSHVVVLRPQGIKPLALVYLLASRWAQTQFRRAESGASGQTTVTEDDIRRFVFPRALLSRIDGVAAKIETERQRIAKVRADLQAEESALWEILEEEA